MNDLVSVIMPSYNTGKYIGESIKSVLNQTYGNLELIIVDDFSTDDTDKIVSGFEDERIKYFKNEKNRGAAISRNIALKSAKGKWIAFLDSDDLWEKDKLEKQLNFMIENGYGMSYSDYRTFLNGKWENCIRTAPNKMTLRKLYLYCYFSTITVIYDRELVGPVEVADLKKNNDYAMWFQVLSKTDGHRFPECLAYYIKHENSISSANKFSLIKHHYILFRKGLGKSRFVATFCTIRNIFFGVFKKIFYKQKIKGNDPENFPYNT